MNRIRTLLVCSLGIASLSVPAVAILGIGDIVFDPSNLQQAILQLTQLEHQYEQLVRTYQTVRDQYEHMRRMAQTAPVDMAARYRALATPWRLSSATNVYGTTGGWVAAINSGADVAAGYARAIQRLAEYGSALGHLPADHVDRVKTSYATVELADGTNQHAIETLGRLRGHAKSVERTIEDLEHDSLSRDPAMNTEIAILNKINAANLIALRTAQDANQLLVTMAETNLIEAKRRRDAEAQSINNHIRFAQEARAAISAQSAGASAAMLAWRMP